MIALGLEAKQIKELSRNKLLVITLGIRPDGYPDDDQQRKTTPRDAVLAGADHLIVGRPITGAKDLRAAQEILDQMQPAFDERAVVA